MHRPLRSGPGSRRAFLGTVGLAASAAGIVGTGGLLLPTSAEAQSCSPPGAGTPVPWRRDCRPVLAAAPGLHAERGGGPEAARRLQGDARPLLERSERSARLRASGERPLLELRRHRLDDPGPWKLAVLRLAPRVPLLPRADPRQAHSDMAFRLPYWDWDVPAHRKLPPAYATPGDASNPLWNGTRFMTRTTRSPTRTWART